MGADTHYASSGVMLTDWFADLPFLGTTEVRRVTFNRTGGEQTVNFSMNAGAVWVHGVRREIPGHILVEDVEINDSTFSGIKISWGKGASTNPPVNNHAISPVTLKNVTIKGAGSYLWAGDLQCAWDGHLHQRHRDGRGLGGSAEPQQPVHLQQGLGEHRLVMTPC